ncbi:MAG TPA: hypothetical protein DCS11_07895, partial [Syntrophus sp. (in: bacteria)]|nr:hypothetical protein [Syntrophus sp. (in: bacteria)]
MAVTRIFIRPCYRPGRHETNKREGRGQGVYVNYFGESHEMLRASIRKFVEREIKPHIEHWEEEGT